MNSNYITFLSRYPVGELVSLTNEEGQLIELKDDTSRDEYYEVTSTPGIPYLYVVSYFKTSLNVKSESQFFYDIKTGITKKYGDGGSLLSQVDEDSGCNFSIDNLKDKLQREYQIDLMHPVEKENVLRFVDADTQKKIYEIFYPIDSYNYRWIQIDCSSGDVIESQIRQNVE